MTTTQEKVFATYYADAGFWLLETSQHQKPMMKIYGNNLSLDYIKTVAKAAGWKVVKHPEAPRALVIHSTGNPRKYGTKTQWIIISAEDGTHIGSLPASLTDPYCHRLSAMRWVSEKGWTVVQSWNGGPVSV